MKKIASIAVILAMALGALGAETPEWEGDNALRRALITLNEGATEDAADQLRDILGNPDFREFHHDALFWLVRCDIALQRHLEAAVAAERFLQEFPQDARVREITYQRARIHFLEGEHEAAIMSFGDFVAAHPQSDLAASAYYWMGEALMALGRLEEADVVFAELIHRYPESLKREASRFRRREIGLMYRERELLDLLKWSHEERLREAEDFYRRESEFRDAISGGSSTDGEGSLRGILLRDRLLAAKDRLLILKEYYLDLLQEASSE